MSQFKMSTLEHIKLVASTIDVATEVESEVETKAQVSQGSAYTTHDEFQNTALFLRLGLPSTRIRHENGAFQKRSSNRRNLKTAALRFSP